MAIDKGISKIVAKLNDWELKTKYSCEGHKGIKGRERGYIVFSRKLDESDTNLAKQILHSERVMKVTSKVKNMKHGNVTVLYFAPRE